MCGVYQVDIAQRARGTRSQNELIEPTFLKFLINRTHLKGGVMGCNLVFNTALAKNLCQ
jgi:hypothetical protein